MIPIATWLPSVPYPPPRPSGYGYWDPVTSTLDWCEENYYATPYAAEIVNTLTNLLFIGLSVKGMYSCWKNGHDTIFFVTFLGCVFVASGSFAFHGSLTYPMQLVDELSMIYTTCLMFWTTFEHKRSLLFKWLLGIFVFGLAVFITLYYHFLQDPTFHQTAYAILTAIVLIRSMYLMEVNLRPYFQKQSRDREHALQNGKRTEADKAEQQRKDLRDKAILKRMWTLVLLGHAVFLGGFAIWNLDNMYCSKIRGWRREIGLPWGLLLEGHGWWHVGTGLGAYIFVVWGIWLRHCLNGRQDEYEIVWPRTFTSIPRVEKVKEKKVLQNGSVRNKKKT